MMWLSHLPTPASICCYSRSPLVVLGQQAYTLLTVDRARSWAALGVSRPSVQPSLAEHYQGLRVAFPSGENWAGASCCRLDRWLGEVRCAGALRPSMKPPVGMCIARGGADLGRARWPDRTPTKRCPTASPPPLAAAYQHHAAFGNPGVSEERLAQQPSGRANSGGGEQASGSSPTCCARALACTCCPSLTRAASREETPTPASACTGGGRVAMARCSGEGWCWPLVLPGSMR